jgi:ABC-type Mn2+/Zn2+ transport system permease subunit
VVAGYFLRENKLSHDGHAMSHVLFALACAGIVLLYMVFFTVVGFIVFLFIWSLFDLMRSEFTHNHNKILWFIMLLFFPVLGMIFYLIISPAQKIPMADDPQKLQ